MIPVERLTRLRNKLNVSAVGVAIVTAQRTEVETQGTVAHSAHDPVRPDDAWHIGSCTKSLTAALYGRLVEQGRARWDATVTDLVPDLDVHPQWASRTISELAWCRAGVRANLPIRDLVAARSDHRPTPEQRTDVARIALQPPPVRPGRFVYSNLSYIVLGAAIDRIAGSWEDAMRTELFEPLGVTSAGFGPPSRIRGTRPLVQLGPLVAGRGRPVNADSPAADNPQVLSSAGTTHLTLPDWARLNRMFQADAPGPLSLATIERLVAEPDGPGHGMAMGWGRGTNGRLGMQGSNTLWSATALQSRDRTRTALVVANDGRTRVLHATGILAGELLDE